MILDMNDPTKILYRGPHAILSPNEHYENDSKPVSSMLPVRSFMAKIYSSIMAAETSMSVSRRPHLQTTQLVTTYGRIDTQ